MKVLRVVALASRTGKYGGPFDTALGQSTLVGEEGHEVRVVAGAFPGDVPQGQANLRTFPVRHLVGSRSFVDVAGAGMFVALWRAARTADLIHVSMAREPVPTVAAIVAKLTRTPLVVQPHGMLTARRSLAHRIFDALVARPLVGSASRIIALTDNERSALEDWSGMTKGRTDVIGNPPPRDLPKELGASDPSTNDFADALFAARLHPRKRVLDFARAAETASRNGWGEHYVVLGPDEGDLTSLVEIVDRTSSLRYAGATDNAGVLDRLKRSRVFVLTSSNEPWGNVLVAALSYGKPVVVTQSSALAGLIDSYGAGRVVPDENPNAIAEAIHEVLAEGQYDDYSARARGLAEVELSARGVKSALLKTYESARRPTTGSHGSWPRSMRSAQLRQRARVRFMAARAWLRRFILTNFGKNLTSVAIARTIVRPNRTIHIIQKWRADARVLPLQKSAHFLDYLEIHHAMASQVGRYPDLVNPTEFNDKIQWLKLFDQRAETIRLADKVAVREWVAERIGPDYLIPVLKITEHPRHLDRTELGRPPYVIKASHDSGSAQIVMNDDDATWQRVTRRLSADLRRHYGTWNSEWPYRYVQPQVIVEKFIGAHGVPPVDYKFNCVNGEVALVRVFWDRGQVPKVSTVYEDGTAAHIQVNPSYEHQEAYELPANWTELCALARRLSEGIPFVRVDLYSTGERIYFGEMTFLPQGGLYRGGDQRELGDLTPIDMSRHSAPVVGRSRQT